MPTTAPQPQRGRRRSEATRRAILAASLALLAERGYAALTIEAIAARAGAGKQTIYRWWPSKAAVVLDALNAQAAMLVPVPQAGTARARLAGFLRETFAGAERQPEIATVLRALMAAAQLDPAFGQQFDAEFLERRRALLRDLLHALLDEERRVATVEEELLVDLVFGTLWYRLLRPGVGAAATRSEDVLALVLAATRLDEEASDDRD
jgi:AcrR family transcriptional regulator